jgi:hypothetical protein
VKVAVAIARDVHVENVSILLYETYR